jgi:hypothetical protein
VWADEIDMLYVHLNSPVEDEVVLYIANLCQHPKIKFMYTDHQIEHGDAIDFALEQVTQEFVMLIEDDCYIFKSGKVSALFELVESGRFDLIGSKRGSCHAEIMDASAMKYRLDYSGAGDTGCNFWPNLFFCRTHTLKDTDRNFKARAWSKGEAIPELNWVVQSDVIYGDTFVNTSIQLMAKYPQDRIHYIPQYHGSPDDQNHASENTHLWDGVASWVHVGSLSSGVGGMLCDTVGRPMAKRKDKTVPANDILPNHCHNENEQREWERRCQWWLTFWETAKDIPETMRDFHTQYYLAIYRIINQYQLSETRIKKRQKIYERLGL